MVTVVVDHTCDDWDCGGCCRVPCATAGGGVAKQSRVCLLSAGEVTVKGAGWEGWSAVGCNQHFALRCSERIAGRDWVVLSAGSDGVDGNSPAAGAVVDGTTTARAEAAGVLGEEGTCGV